MASRWTRTAKWNAPCLVLWLLGYTSKIKERKGIGERVTENITPTVEQIIELEQWAMSELEITEPHSLCHTQIAITLREFSHFDKSTERSIKARDLDPNNWRAVFCLAQIATSKENYQEGLDMVKTVIEMFKNDDALMEEWQETFWNTIVYFKTQCHLALEQFDEAEADYRAIYEHDPSSYIALLPLIQPLRQREKYNEIAELLQTLDTEMTDDGVSRAAVLSLEYAISSEYHETIIMAGLKADCRDVIKEIYEHSFAVESTEGTIASLC
ncbi:hypothetical protein VTO42DRAFT_8117 [Malbranchea cinnamomea]